MVFRKALKLKCVLAFIVTALMCLDTPFFVTAKEVELTSSRKFISGKVSTRKNLVEKTQNLRQSRTIRVLQEDDDSPSFTFSQFLGIALNGGSTLLGSVGIFLENIMEIGSEIVELISDNDFSLGGVLNIIGEGIVETVVEISASVVSFLVEDFSFLLQNNIKESLKDYDPVDLMELSPSSINQTSFNITSGSNCTVSFNLTSMIVHGLSDVNFDTFEIDDFSYSNNELKFTWDLKIAVPQLDLDFKGIIKSTDMCVGGPVEYLSETSFGEVSLIMGVSVLGNVASDGTELVVTSANFSKIGLEGLETSDTTLSNISPYEDVRDELLNVFSTLVDRIFGDLSSLIPDPENFLEDVGIDLPLTVTLPVPFPV